MQPRFFFSYNECKKYNIQRFFFMEQGPITVPMGTRNARSGSWKNELVCEERGYSFRRTIFLVNPGSIEYSELLLGFELLFESIKEDLCNQDFSLVIIRFGHSFDLTCQNFSNKRDPLENLTLDLRLTLRL